MKRMNMLTMMAITLSFISLFVLSGSVHAQTLSDTDFEGFTIGISVDGQGGWGSTGNWDEEVVDDGTGNNVWRVSNAATSGSFGNMPFAPRPGGIPTDSVNNPTNGFPFFFAGEASTGAAHDRFTGRFSFRSATGAPQPGLVITVSADNGQGARQSFVALRDTGLGIDIETFDVNPNTGEFIGPIIIASNLSYSDWHIVEMQANFVNGLKNDNVIYFVNENLVHVGTSWEEFYRNFQSDLHPLGVPVQTLLFRLSGTSVPSVEGNGFYIDNVITAVGENTGPVRNIPTLSEWGLMAMAGILGMFGIIVLRRRKLAV